MADAEIPKLTVEEQVARIKAAKEAAKQAAADKLAASAAALAAVPEVAAVVKVSAPVPVAASTPVPVQPVKPVVLPVAAAAGASENVTPIALAGSMPGTEIDKSAPPAPPAPGSVEEQVAKIKAAKAAAALKSPGGTSTVPKPAATAVAGGAVPAPGSVEEKVAQIKAAKAAAAAKNAGGTGAVVSAAPIAPSATLAAVAPAPGSVEEKVAQIKAAKAAAAAKAAGAAPVPVAAAGAAVPATAGGYTEPGTPEAIARAAAVHAKALGATGIDARGTPANKPAVQLLAAAKPGVAKTPPKKEEKQTGPLPPPPQMAPRRAFLGFITLGTFAWLAFFTWLAGVSHMFLRFMFPNVLYESDPKFNAGRKNDYPEAPHVYERFKQDQAVWIVRLTEDGEDRLVALSTVCTHLGCTPNWLETEQKFKCPCHGSGYYLTGVNFEGPTPRPLERFRIFVDGSGNIIVDKAKKYRQDLAQWNENQSFLAMG